MNTTIRNADEKQRDIQIMFAVLCAEAVLPMYEYDRPNDYTPHKTLAIATKYVQAETEAEAEAIEIDAELAMLEIDTMRGRDWTGVANVAWHTIRAVVYPKRTAESSSYARHFASQIVARAGVICARLGEANRYATDFDELKKQAIALVDAM